MSQVRHFEFLVIVHAENEQAARDTLCGILGDHVEDGVDPEPLVLVREVPHSEYFPPGMADDIPQEAG